MSSRYSDIDVMTCLQGNTVRKNCSYSNAGSHGFGYENDIRVERDRCVVYDFRREAASSRRTRSGRNSARVSKSNASCRKPAKRGSGKRASRARAGRVFALRIALFAFLVMFTMLGIGGIASRAKSKEVPAAYKYYDTITVGYQENLLDIVERYDDRDHYKTQIDYVEELCRINNLAFDGTAYPTVTPGTHLVVPYYSTELK